MTKQTSLAAVAEAAAGALDAEVVAPAPAPIAAAEAAAPSPPPAAPPPAVTQTIGAAEALELLATGYPGMASILTPLAAKVRAGCTEAAFGREILALVAGGAQPKIRHSPADNSVPLPDRAPAAEVVDTPGIYAARAQAMGQ